MHRSYPTTLIVTLATAALVGSLLSACASTPERGASTAAPASTDGIVHSASQAERDYLSSKSPIESSSVTLAVNGLSCPLCASNVDKQLQDVAGVGDIKIDFATGQIDLTLTDPKPAPFALTRAIDRAGFTLVKISSH